MFGNIVCHFRFLILFGLFLLGLFLLSNDEANSETLMEKLGYQADDVLLIPHADDMGMCHSANVACIEALEKGIVTCASVMVPCPWFPEVAAYARENPETDLGLHLTYTAEWKHYRWGPLSPRSLVPGLIDPDGYFYHGVLSVINNAKPEEIERETRAQIEHAINNGLNPTHLDSHMGTLYASTEFTQVVMKLSEEYDIPFMFFNPTPEILERAGQDREEYLVQFSQELRERGIPLIDSLPQIPDDTPVEEMDEAYRKLISELKPGVHILILHPNVLTPESRAITGTHKERDKEYRIFTDPEMKEFIDDQGVKLVGWKNLLEVWKKRVR